jgi:hypothetical protein
MMIDSIVEVAERARYELRRLPTGRDSYKHGFDVGYYLGKAHAAEELAKLCPADIKEENIAPTNTGNQKLLSKLIDIRDCLAGCDQRDHAVAFNELNKIIAQLQESLKQSIDNRGDEIALFGRWLSMWENDDPEFIDLHLADDTREWLKTAQLREKQRTLK